MSDDYLTDFLTVNPLRVNDERIREASVLARLIWANLLVADLGTGIPGLVTGGPASIAEHIGLPYEAVRAAMDEMVALGVVEYDIRAHLTRMIGIVADYGRLAQSPNSVKFWIRTAKKLRPCDLLRRHAIELAALNESFRARWLEVAGSSPSKPLASPPEGLTPQTAAPNLDPDLDPDLDLDLDPPLVPPEGREGEEPHDRAGADRRGEPIEALAGEAHRVLDEVRQQVLDLGPAPPLSRKDLQAVRQLVRDRPKSAAQLPTIVRRAAERRRRELAEGRDYRHHVTLPRVCAQWDEFEGATQFDTAQPRAPPPAARKPSLDFAT